MMARLLRMRSLLCAAEESLGICVDENLDKKDKLQMRIEPVKVLLKKPEKRQDQKTMIELKVMMQ
jgi:hypothetical protein